MNIRWVIVPEPPCLWCALWIGFVQEDVQELYVAMSDIARGQDKIDTLLDLARQGNEATFKDLARCWGVGAEEWANYGAGRWRE